MCQIILRAMFIAREKNSSPLFHMSLADYVREINPTALRAVYSKSTYEFLVSLKCNYVIDITRFNRDVEKYRKSPGKRGAYQDSQVDFRQSVLDREFETCWLYSSSSDECPTSSVCPYWRYFCDYRGRKLWVFEDGVYSDKECEVEIQNGVIVAVKFPDNRRLSDEDATHYGEDGWNLLPSGINYLREDYFSFTTWDINLDVVRLLYGEHIVKFFRKVGVTKFIDVKTFEKVYNRKPSIGSAWYTSSNGSYDYEIENYGNVHINNGTLIHFTFSDCDDYKNSDDRGDCNDMIPPSDSYQRYLERYQNALFEVIFGAFF